MLSLKRLCLQNSSKLPPKSILLPYNFSLYNFHPSQKSYIDLKLVTSKARAFIEFERHPESYRNPSDRISDWNEINIDASSIDPTFRKIQAARCMDCGTPFCQTYTGCPLRNLIPEWNHLAYVEDWRQAIDKLHYTNNFPEFTGRVCPAPCEGACVAGIVDSPVTIKNIEYSIIDNAFKKGWVKPRYVLDSKRTDLICHVVGSGPAGLACADMLNQFGHTVHVHERQDEIGGLLMYGIPNMKLSKDTVKRRVNLLAEEGITFHTNSYINSTADVSQLGPYDALIFATGATIPRGLPNNIPGRELGGIHYAMEFLTSSQKSLLFTRNGEIQSAYDYNEFISAKDKNVIILGGGDTGTDCIGTSIRQHCNSILNFELLNKPPKQRDPEKNPWPEYPKIYKIDYGHEEYINKYGYDPRLYNIMTKEILTEDGQNISGVKTVNVEISSNGKIKEIPGTEMVYACDLLLIAMGFVSHEKNVFDELAVEMKHTGRDIMDYTTSIDNIFVAGDCRRGQSLVVWAIAEGRGCAQRVQEYFIESHQVPNVIGNSQFYSRNANGQKQSTKKYETTI